MKIKQLNIENYRGFEQASITFPDNNLAVFIGANGAGKTSVLDLVAGLAMNFLSTFTIIAVYKSTKNNKKEVGNAIIDFNSLKIAGISNEFNFQQSDINLDKESSKNTLSFSFLDSNTLFTDLEIQLNNLPISYNWGNAKLNYVEIKNKKIQINLPIFVYYQFHLPIIKPKKRLATFVNDYVYDDILGNIDNFTTFKTWFKNEEDLENQEKVNQENLAYRNPKLEIVRKALETFFQKIESPVFAKMRIHRQGSKTFDFNKTFSTDSLLIDKGGQPFEIERLSSGEKSLMLLVADIARRLSIANPAFSPAEALQKGEGVVLIDEIEQHLHPRWQRLVLPALQATFPNVHFIVTTHSPQIVSSVPRESVFILDNFQIKDYKPYTQGRDSNSILQDVFGVETYPQAYKEKLHQLHQLIHDEKADEAQKLMQELISYWGENDREIKRAQLYLDDIV